LDVSAIASSLSTDRRATELLLNALAALGLLAKTGQQFSLAPASTKYLVKSSAHYLGGMILFEDSLWDCWKRLGEAVRSGQPARPPNMYQDDDRETERFINAMGSLVKARGDAEIVASVLDGSQVTELLDVGSGPATYPIFLCRKYPKLRATIFDLPGTLKITLRYVRGAGLEDRITLVSGDYRNDPIPGLYQLIFLSNVIHGEGYEENQRLIAKLSSGLEPGGRIVIKDHILDATHAHPPVGAIFSLLMLLTTEAGRCYSFDEVKNWLTQAGLGKVKQIDLPAPLTSSLVVGEK
jgi:SAM-dependent methyltransferase